MRVHSFLPFLGLSLVSLSVAEDIPEVIYRAGAAIEVHNNSTLAQRRMLQRTPRLRQRAGPTICDTLPAGWTYSGCYTDTVAPRALSGTQWRDDTGMTEEKCIAFCDNKGYNIAGVEFGVECFCGLSIGSSGVVAPESECNMPCSGNSDELCGAGDRLNIFKNSDATPKNVQRSNGYIPSGCHLDQQSSRTLSKRVSLPGNIRVDDCTYECKRLGYSFAGLEYGNECWCGRQPQSGREVDESFCSMPCKGDRTQICGGPDAISMYRLDDFPSSSQIPTGWSYQSCYTDQVSARTLSHKLSLSPVSVATCLAACNNEGYLYAGLEFGSECFCGNSLSSNAQPNQNGCDMPCNGQAGDVCGGADRISVYMNSKPTAKCGVAGCWNGSGLYVGTLWKDTRAQCLEECKSRPACTFIQWGNGPQDARACNLFNVPLLSNYYQYSYTSTYCMSFSFYDRTCLL